VRANTDVSGTAQQEPHLALSRRNPDVMIVAAKDFRNTETLRAPCDHTCDDGGRRGTSPLNSSENIFPI
jgi:hypothetical protein